MNAIALTLGLTLALSPLASAGGFSTNNYYNASTTLKTLNQGKTADTGLVARAMNYSGTLPTDGPITLTRTVTDTDSSSNQTTRTTSVMTVNLVMKDGKIASIDASATRKSVTTYEGFYATYVAGLMKLLGQPFENPAKSDLGLTNIIQKSFDTSTPTPAAHTVVKNQNTPGDDTTKKTGTDGTTNAQQEVKTAVSPSSP